MTFVSLTLWFRFNFQVEFPIVPGCLLPVLTDLKTALRMNFKLTGVCFVFFLTKEALGVGVG